MWEYLTPDVHILTDWYKMILDECIFHKFPLHLKMHLRLNFHNTIYSFIRKQTKQFCFFFENAVWQKIKFAISCVKISKTQRKKNKSAELFLLSKKNKS